MTDLNINSSYKLSDDQIQNYRNNGFVYLPGVCSIAEVNYYGDSIRDVVNERIRIKELKPGNGDNNFLQTLNLRFDCPKVMDFVLSKRFGRIASELMGVDAVRIFHEQVLFKEPKTPYTPWHQDLVYWPLDTKNALGMWMALCDVTVDMGPIKFAKGSHKNGFLQKLVISEESEKYLSGVVEKDGYEIVSIPMQAGDITFHNGWLIHGANENRSKKLREAMIVTFFEDGTKVIIDNEYRKNDAKIYLDGCHNGDKAESKLNPVTWSKSW